MTHHDLSRQWDMLHKTNANQSYPLTQRSDNWLIRILGTTSESTKSLGLFSRLLLANNYGQRVLKESPKFFILTTCLREYHCDHAPNWPGLASVVPLLQGCIQQDCVKEYLGISGRV